MKFFVPVTTFIKRHITALHTVPIFMIGVFLIFFRLTRPDLIQDDAHYALRAVDYFDYLFSQNQTTPVQWFGYEPWWSKLSFHDHPPLVFATLHLFFMTFGVSPFVAKLPFALAGAATLAALYHLVRLLYDGKTASVALLLLSINAYFIWAARVGYLEIFVIFFSTLSFVFLQKSTAQERLLLAAATSAGLAMLSKYTALFIVPVFVITLFAHRSRYHVRTLFSSLVILIAILSPVIIYNQRMYHTRGHFDVQIASFLQQSSSDWPILTRSASFTPLTNIASIATHLIDAFSAPVFLLFLVSLGFIIWDSRTRDGVTRHAHLLTTVISLILLFAVVGPASRYLSLFAVPACVTIAYAVTSYFRTVFNIVHRRKRILVSITTFMAVFFVLYQLFYTFHTNHSYRPWGIPGRDYAHIRIDNLGFYELDVFLTQLLHNTKALPQKMVEQYQHIPWLHERSERLLADQSRALFPTLLLYDRNINWFGRVWVFDRRTLTDGYVSFSFDDWQQKLALEPQYRTGYDFSSAYLFMPGKKNESLARTNSHYSFLTEEIQSYFIRHEHAPLRIITNPAGEECFYVYYIDDFRKLPF